MITTILIIACIGIKSREREREENLSEATFVLAMVSARSERKPDAEGFVGSQDERSSRRRTLWHGNEFTFCPSFVSRQRSGIIAAGLDLIKSDQHGVAFCSPYPWD